MEGKKASNSPKYAPYSKNILIPKDIKKNLKILKNFKEKNLYLVADKSNNSNKSYILIILDELTKEELREIKDKLKLHNLIFNEEIEDNKILLNIFIPITESDNIIALNEDNIPLFGEKDILIILFRLVIKLKVFEPKCFEYNFNINDIFIDDKNNVLLNLIDLVLSKNNYIYLDKEKEDYIINEKENEDNLIDISNKNIKNINNINIIKENNNDDIYNIKKSKKKFIQTLGIAILKLSLNEKFPKYIDINKINLSKIKIYIELIKDKELKNLLLKILYNEDKISSLNELILEKIFLKKLLN